MGLFVLCLFVSVYAVNPPNITSCSTNANCSYHNCSWSAVSGADGYEWKDEVNWIPDCGTWCTMNQGNTTATYFNNTNVFMGMSSTYYKGSVRAYDWVLTRIYSPALGWIWINLQYFSDWDWEATSITHC